MNMLRIVILTLICIFICCAFAGDSYQESKPGNEKRKSEALWKKLNNLKPLFKGNEEHCISKEVKGNALASKGKSCRPKTTITAVNVCHDLSVWNKRQNSHLLSQNVFFRGIIYPPEPEKCHWNKQHFSMRPSRVLPTDFVFTLEWFFFI